jgi:para-aminobenzoate synthetase component 1
MTISTTLDEFVRELPKPLVRVHSEELTLSEPFIDMVGRFANEPGTVALLSGGTLDSARYHILGLRPWLSVRERGGKVIADFTGGSASADLDPFAVLEALVKRYALPGLEETLPLSAGLLGYLAYDLKDCLEVLPRTSRDDLGLPRLFLAAPSILIVHDRNENRTTVHLPVLGEEKDDDEEGARRRLARFKQELSRSERPVRTANTHVGQLQSGLSREEYTAAVEAVRDYIVRGHVYQVNMSQRFETEFRGDAFALFASLFQANPAPFFSFVQAGDHQIVSTSPERFIELRGKTVETRPIKGTRPRGKTPDQDRALRQELETAPKDDAELSMIVDLLRNDIGKVCAAGSVRVTEHKRVETYENVYHLVSVVRGELDDDKNAVDLIRATFPGGSITGCPKIRSMEIIDELEPVRRHIYTGSIGYLGFRGTMDLSIAIRTATIADGRLVFSVGGGVVFDSKASDEFEETLHKGRTLMSALERKSPPTTTEGGLNESHSARPRLGWCNGKVKPMAEMTVSVEDEGFAYGYGFFETIRVQHGRARMLDAHLARFRRAWNDCLRHNFPGFHLAGRDRTSGRQERVRRKDRRRQAPGGGGQTRTERWGNDRDGHRPAVHAPSRREFPQGSQTGGLPSRASLASCQPQDHELHVPAHGRKMGERAAGRRSLDSERRRIGVGDQHRQCPVQHRWQALPPHLRARPTRDHGTGCVRTSGEVGQACRESKTHRGRAQGRRERDLDQRAHGSRARSRK